MRRALLPLASLAAVALLATAGPAAHAKCAAPSPFIAAPDDGVVPPEPFVFVFTPAAMELREVRALGPDGAVIGVEHVKLPGTESWNVARLRVKTATPGKITVVATIRAWGDRTWEIRRELTVALPLKYPLPRAGAPTKLKPTTTVADLGVSHYRWTCSHESVRRLGVEVLTSLGKHVAPAYRVDVLVGGEVRRTSVFPSASDRFFAFGDDKPPAAAVLALGHINCFGSSFDWRGVDAVDVRVTALFPDGDEVASAVTRVAAP
ncbi:MAG: hypothetical protein EP329_08800 [Deltaproteobacteria bacterium]|nr:MAG: hypothetical protein EP329_08800 [Deltaproteobacteria bacterium]